jgi:hypothetical protein
LENVRDAVAFEVRGRLLASANAVQDWLHRAAALLLLLTQRRRKKKKTVLGPHLLKAFVVCAL